MLAVAYCEDEQNEGERESLAGGREVARGSQSQSWASVSLEDAHGLAVATGQCEEQLVAVAVAAKELFVAVVAAVDASVRRLLKMKWK